MGNLRREISTVLAIMLMFVMFTGCSAPSKEKTATAEQSVVSTSQDDKKEADTSKNEDKPIVILSRWAGPHADDQKTVVAKYSDATVKIDDLDYGNLKQKQIQSLSSSADYDLVWTQEIWTPEYIDKGWLLPLDDLVKSTDTDLSIYSQSMIKMNTVDGKLYALPTFAQTHILTYNKEWFEKEGQKVPTTVEELVATAKYFHEKGTGIALPASQGQAAVDVFAQLLYSTGGDYFDADGKVNLTSEEALFAAQLWDELCKYSIVGSDTWHHDQVSQAIREEKAPFGITVTGLTSMDSDPEVSAIVDKVGYAPIPGKKEVAGCISYWSWAVANNSRNPEAAFKVAAWLTSTEIEKEQALMNGQVSAISSLASDNEVVAKIPSLPATSITMEKAKTQPTSAAAAQIFEALSAGLSELAITESSASDVFTKVQDQLSGITK